MAVAQFSGAMAAPYIVDTVREKSSIVTIADSLPSAGGGVTVARFHPFG
jgi:hypothetical protein